MPLGARRYPLGMVGRLPGLGLVCFLILATQVFAASASGGASTRPHFDRAVIILERQAATPLAFTVELAVSEAQHRYGLMYSPPLPAMTGMLFIFDQAAPRRFWMKNTPIRLDILFFDASGGLLSFVPMAPPLSEAVIDSKGPARYVLEIAGGSAATLGIGLGARLALDPAGRLITAMPQEK